MKDLNNFVIDFVIKFVIDFLIEVASISWLSLAPYQFNQFLYWEIFEVNLLFLQISSQPRKFSY